MADYKILGNQLQDDLLISGSLQVDSILLNGDILSRTSSGSLNLQNAYGGIALSVINVPSNITLTPGQAGGAFVVNTDGSTERLYVSAAVGVRLDNTTTIKAGVIKPNNGEGYLSCPTGTSITLGNSTESLMFVDAWYTVGIYNQPIAGTNRAVYCRDDGVLGYLSSLREAKTNIQELTASDIDWLYLLKPSSFNYRKNTQDIYKNQDYSTEYYNTKEYGLIADEVELINPDLCYYLEEYNHIDGCPSASKRYISDCGCPTKLVLNSVAYEKLPAILLKAIQVHKDKLSELETRIAILEAN